MIPWQEVRRFVLRELQTMPSTVWLDIFYLILKEEGRSYLRCRTAWLKQRQLDLEGFNVG